MNNQVGSRKSDREPEWKSYYWFTESRSWKPGNPPLKVYTNLPTRSGGIEMTDSFQDKARRVLEDIVSEARVDAGSLYEPGVHLPADYLDKHFDQALVALTKLKDEELRRELEHLRLPTDSDLETPYGQTWKFGGTDVASYKRGFNQALAWVKQRREDRLAELTPKEEDK